MDCGSLVATVVARYDYHKLVNITSLIIAYQIPKNFFKFMTFTVKSYIYVYVNTGIHTLQLVRTILCNYLR